jgi:UDP-galactopyranose mutase
MKKKETKQVLIIGAGLTGLTLAERCANDGNKVLIIEQRSHIGGNCFDQKSKAGVLVHKYGPHIFHTNHKEVFEYLSKFTEWNNYEHKVLGFVDKKYVPIPFNLNTLFSLLPQKAELLEEKLIKSFGENKKIPILELKKTKDKDLKFLANFIYKKIFLDYTKKQWGGRKPEKLDSSVTARVPVLTSRDDRYFQDKYQGMPKNGYTKMFERMAKNKNIKIKLNTSYKNKVREGHDLLFFTGPIDEFFNYKFGKLEYRKLKMEFKTLNKKEYQPGAVVNYPDLEHPFTRITEFKKMTWQKHEKTTVGIEYPGNEGFETWPVLDNKNRKILERYKKEVEGLKNQNIYFVGRLAEFKYYNMDEVVKNALDIYKNVKA